MKAPSIATYTKVLFVVAAYGEDAQHFNTEAAAKRAAVAAARRTGCADYYRVVGEPRTDIWRQPELLGGFEWDPAVGVEVEAA